MGLLKLSFCGLLLEIWDSNMSSRLEDFRKKSPSPLNNVYVAKT
jgi:hypothetical protein